MNVYCFYFSTASNSPARVPFSCNLQCCALGGWWWGVCALLAMVTQIGIAPPPVSLPPQKENKVLIWMSKYQEYPVLS